MRLNWRGSETQIRRGNIPKNTEWLEKTENSTHLVWVLAGKPRALALWLALTPSGDTRVQQPRWRRMPNKRPGSNMSAGEGSKLQDSIPPSLPVLAAAGVAAAGRACGRPTAGAARSPACTAGRC